MEKLLESVFFYILAGFLTLFLAMEFVPGVKIQTFPSSYFLSIPLNSKEKVILVIGSLIGLFNLIFKPLLKKISLPFEVLTFGVFGFFLNMAILWFFDIIFLELEFLDLKALFLTTLISQVLSFFFGLK
jgi:uncharacterized membrane protein YvlD (DUF360 family)